MRILLYISLIIFTISSGRINTKHDAESMLIDSLLFVTFNKGYSDMGTNLTLKDNWTFVYEDYYYSDYIQEGEPSGWKTLFLGKFKIDSNILYLIPETFSHTELYDNAVILIDSAKYSDSDSTTINKKYTIVKWSGNIYLLSEEISRDLRFRTNNDFEKFADNYNSGSEPRWNGKYFAKRVNRHRTEKLDKNQIPIAWRDYFLDKMVKLVVNNIEENIAYDSLFDSPINRYELISGESDGVKAGMTFYGKDGCCILKIMEVEKNRSFGLIELCPNHQNACEIGDTLTSWNIRDNGEYLP